MEEENIDKISKFMKNTIDINSAHFSSKINMDKFKNCDLDYFKNSILNISDCEPEFNLLDWITKIEQFGLMKFPKNNEDLLQNFRNKQEKIKICQEILLKMIKSEVFSDTERKKKILYPMYDSDYKRGVMKKLKKL